jgi:hypothetical protein
MWCTAATASKAAALREERKREIDGERERDVSNPFAPNSQTSSLIKPATQTAANPESRCARVLVHNVAASPA